MKTLLVVVAGCALAMSSRTAQAGPANFTEMGKTGVFVFVTARSTVTQGGGIAGVHEVYPIQGQFQVTVDANMAAASLGPVDANLTRESPFLQGRVNVGDLFAMSELIGIIKEDGKTIEFAGSFDLEAVALTLSLTAEGASLTGSMFSPHCNDCFTFDVNAVAAYAYGGGRGEPNDPYLIYTPEQMNAIGADPNRDNHFKLMADIDLSACTGATFNVIGDTYGMPYNGTFDGNGREIRNLTITSDSGRCIGLFGTLGRFGCVKNLGLLDANVAAHTYVGALVGYNAGGTIENCWVTGSVYGTGYTGGVAGICMDNALIRDCRADVSVIGAWYETGGIAGANSTSTITRCIAKGTVIGKDSTGGVTGRQDWGLVSDSSSACSVKGGRVTGGLVGRNAYSEVSGCFATGDVSGSEVVGGLVGFSDSEVRDSWAGATVSGTSLVGGLTGQNMFAFVFRSYSRSVVKSKTSKGGLVGAQRGTCLYAGCFWDCEVDVLPPAIGEVAGVLAKPSGELKMGQTFTQAGWDFVDETANGTKDIWRIDEGKDYPRLAWERVSTGEPAGHQ